MEQILVMGIGEVGLADAQIQDSATGKKLDAIILSCTDSDSGRVYQLAIPEEEFDGLVGSYMRRKAEKKREASGIVIPGRMPNSTELDTMQHADELAARAAAESLPEEQQRKAAAVKMPPKPR